MCFWEEPCRLDFSAFLEVERAKGVIVAGARNGYRSNELTTDTLIEYSPF